MIYDLKKAELTHSLWYSTLPTAHSSMHTSRLYTTRWKMKESISGGWTGSKVKSPRRPGLIHSGS
jgi:hypothetical protein